MQEGIGNHTTEITRLQQAGPRTLVQRKVKSMPPMSREAMTLHIRQSLKLPTVVVLIQGTHDAAGLKPQPIFLLPGQNHLRWQRIMQAERHKVCAPVLSPVWQAPAVHGNGTGGVQSMKARAQF
jgi:hypothetical protein